MKHVHVCLVSDQPIPNILGICHFKPDEILFISTSSMRKKKKTESIIETLKRLELDYTNKYKEIEVQEDSILDCHRQIDQWIKGREDSEFVVNLTCGTKIMSIAAYEYFKDYQSRMIYIPIRGNEFIIPFPKRVHFRPVPITARLSVDQYLTAYGLRIINEKKLTGYVEEAAGRKQLSNWILDNYSHVKNLLVWLSSNLRKYRDRKQHELTAVFHASNSHERALIRKMGFSMNGDEISKRLARSEICYLTGGWLEEYCFNVVKELSDRGINDAAIGLKMATPQGRDNEFDIMFTKDNALYFIECKSLDQHNDKNARVLYQIGALQKEFGLKVKSFLVSTSPYILKDGKIRQSVQARAEQFNTRIVTPDEVADLKDILISELT